MSDWLRRDKWIGFYQGSYAPHLPRGADCSSASQQLPWRSHLPASQLQDFLATVSPGGRALELGCGTGENLVALAQHGFDFVCGVDIVQEAVDISISALKDLEMHSSRKSAWQVLCADILELRQADIALLDGGRTCGRRALIGPRPTVDKASVNLPWLGARCGPNLDLLGGAGKSSSFAVPPTAIQIPSAAGLHLLQHWSVTRTAASSFIPSLYKACCSGRKPLERHAEDLCGLARHTSAQPLRTFAQRPLGSGAPSSTVALLRVAELRRSLL
eukprot:Skav222871  [mRNA]  locus=scaffold2201:427025:432750:- [translate_table: standard]